MFNKPATGLFGNNASSFGTAAPAFGTNTTFGAGGGFGSPAFGSQPAQSGGLFGTNPAATSAGGLFGGGTSTFGAAPAANTGFSFGAATAAVPPTVQIGAGAGGTGGVGVGGLFGSSTGGGFGATSQPSGSLSLFGATSQPMNGSTYGVAANSGGSLFGGSSFLGTGAPSTGTVVKFVPVAGSDVMMKGGAQQSVATKLQCITGMKEYENKSLEELRYEDYLANRKGQQIGQQQLVQQQLGQQQQQQPTLGGFLGAASQPTASSTSAFGVFGQPSKPAFSGFGATPSTGTSSLFGQPQTQQQSSSLFGVNSQPKSLFSTTTTASPFGGLTTQSIFGQSTAQKTGLFGSTPATQSGGLFGSAPTAASTSAPGFGTGGFGTSNTFGMSTASGGLFGQKPAGFGTSMPGQTTFAFGQTPQQNALGGGTVGVGPGVATGGLFGAKSTAPSTGISFGQPATTGFGGFGMPATTGALGGTAAPFGTGLGLNLGMAGNSGNSLFQQNQAKPPAMGLGGGGLFGFGNTGANLGLNTNTLGGGGGQGDLNAALALQQQQVQQQLQILSTSPYGDSPLFRNLKQDSARKDELLKPTNPEAQKAALAASSQLKVTGRPNYKIKPKPLQSIITGKGQLFDGLEEDESALDTETFVPRRNFKKLTFKSNGASVGGSGMSSPASFTLDNNYQSQLKDLHGNSNDGQLSAEHQRERSSGNLRSDRYSLHGDMDNTVRELNTKNRMMSENSEQHGRRYSYGDQDIDANNGPEYDDNHGGNNFNENDADEAQSHPTGIVLRRSDYFTLPSLNELVEMMDANGECWVENFVVGRDGYGSVAFPGLTNVAGLNLDEIVHFRSKEIDLYPNEDNKPPIGEGLNKKAQVTLDRVWPADKTTAEVIKDYDRLLKMGYLDKLEKASIKIGAKFIDYRHLSGSWVFEVKHFSKYGLLDDSDDDDVVSPSAALPPPANKNVPEQAKQPQMPLKQNEQMLEMVNESQSVRFKLNDEKKKDEVATKIRFHDDDDEDAEMPDIMQEKLLEEETRSHISDKFDDMDDDDVAMTTYSVANIREISAARLQIQKASFFGVDEDDFSGSPYPQGSPFSSKKMCLDSSEIPVGLLKQSMTTFSPQVPRTIGVSRDMNSPMRNLAPSKNVPEFGGKKDVQLQSSVHPLVPSALSADRKVTTKQQRHPVQLQNIPFDESLFADKQTMLMDLGLVHGNRSRVGWTAGWTLAHTGQPLMIDAVDDLDVGKKKVINIIMSGNQKKNYLKKLSPAEVVVESVMPETTTTPKATMDLLTECLQVQLEHSRLDDAESECPYFIPHRGVSLLHSYSDKVQNIASSCELRNLMSMTWTLCVALWGDLHLSEEFADDTYICHQARKVLLAEWLTTTTELTVDHEIDRNALKGNDGASTVFSYLTGGRIEKACEHALLCRDYNLALLIAEATGSDECRSLLQRQLAMWAETLTDNFIDKDHMRIYALLAGTLVWNSSEDHINTCAELDWKRCLALHLWFKCSNTATIMESLEAYENAFEGTSVHGVYAVPPRPTYMERLGLEDKDVLDVCYHLLKLFSSKAHPLHILLNPSTMSGNQLDYSLSWHLLQVLEGLGYRHLSDVHHSMVCTNYASQLESLGLWQWAVFVLLHIRNHESRSSAVHQLLLRYVTLDLQPEDDGHEDFIVNSLHVKPEWIHFAKAVEAKAGGNRFLEAWHLLKAEKWNPCHELIMTGVAPEAIVNENYCFVELLLKELAEPDIVCHIRDWKIGGGVYLDYLVLRKHFQLCMQNTLAYEADNEGVEHGTHGLYDLAASINARIGNMLCNSHTDSLCQATMSKYVTQVMTVLAKQQPEQRLFADILSSVSLPEDFALEALAQMSHALQAVVS